MGSKMLRLFSVLFLVLALFMDTPLARAEQRAAPLFSGGDLLWVRSFGGSGHEYAPYIEVDSNGNVYVTRSFQGTVDFDPGPGVLNLTSFGGDDIYIARFNSTGNLQWVRQIGGTQSDSSSDVALDTDGNVYVTGSFHGTVDFDPGAGIFNMVGGDLGDIFVLKLDSDGHFVWAKKLGVGRGQGIGMDAAGNVYTTGVIWESSDFDPGTDTHMLGDPIFISKLDANGNFLWAKGFGGQGAGTNNQLAIDPGGTVYVIGDFIDTLDFDPGPGIANLTSAGLWDIFLTKLDSNGNLIWAKRIGGESFDNGFAVDIDSSGNIYGSGAFSETVDFDPGPGTWNLTSQGLRDIFAMKLDPSGNLLWAKGMGGGEDDGAGFIDLDSAGHVYLGGVFVGPADLNPGAGIYTLSGLGKNDLFVARLNPSGDFVWAKSFEGPDDQYGFSLALDADDNVYAAGGYRGTMDADPGPGTHSLNSVGGEDVLLVKLEAGIFGDVPAQYWAQEYIERLYNSGITGGCNTNPLQYCPEGTVTRAQMAVFLLRGIYGSSYSPPATGVNTGFGDVPTTYWAAAWIKQLAAERVTAGCGNGNYCPEGAVTRAEMAVFLLKAKHGAAYSPPGLGESTGFADVPTNHWAAAWIKQLVAEGITAGCGNGNYCPDGPVTRAQMAVFLVKTFSLP